MCLREVVYDVCHDAFHDFADDVLECDGAIYLSFDIIWLARFPEYYCCRVFECFGEVSEVDARLH